MSWEKETGRLFLQLKSHLKKAPKGVSVRIGRKYRHEIELVEGEDFSDLLLVVKEERSYT